jgi:hypothetical protein
METRFPPVLNKESAANIVEFAKLAQKWAKQGAVKKPTPQSVEAARIAGILLTRLATYTKLLNDIEFDLRYHPYHAVKPSAQALWVRKYSTRVEKADKYLAEFRKYVNEIEQKGKAET